MSFTKGLSVVGTVDEIGTEVMRRRMKGSKGEAERWVQSRANAGYESCVNGSHVHRPVRHYSG